MLPRYRLARFQAVPSHVWSRKTRSTLAGVRNTTARSSTESTACRSALGKSPHTIGSTLA
jgi:hypothetical protein